ncbi:MAG: protein-L-isoaspartate O-methyltransferase family protein [Nanoarchaeota archaeon]
MKKQQLIQELKKQKFPERILKAFEKVPRELFISPELKQYAYQNQPLPIGKGQTISQPYTIAFMLSLLDVRDNQSTLEIGSGSGYVLALLSELSQNSCIVGVERIKELAENSQEKLKNYKNVKVIHRSALENLGNEKYDRILASASFKELPQEIINSNLKIGGIAVFPIQNSIAVIRKTQSENKINYYPGFRFVPIVKE